MTHRSLGLIAVLGLGLLFFGSAQAQLRDLNDDSIFIRHHRTGGGDTDDDDDEGYDGLGFGKKIAGAWLGSGEFSVDLGCDGVFEIGPIPFMDSQSFGVAGDHVVTNPGNPNTGLGTWTKTGHREISGRDTSFAVDMTPGGVVTTVAIVSFVYSFDSHFKTAITTFGAKVYLPTQNPLDPAEIPVACSLGSHDSFVKVSPTE
jgi:hypothetical protein